jgi:anti-anti-sigma factor
MAFTASDAPWKMQRRIVVPAPMQGTEDPVDAVTYRIAISGDHLLSGTLTIAVIGELDLGTAAAFHRQICTLLDGRHGGCLDLDLTLLDFCDLAGVRAIHAVAEAAAATQHQTRITAAAPAIDTVLQLCQIPAFLGYTPPPKAT